MRIHVYYHHSWDEEVPPWVCGLKDQLDLTLDRLDTIMIDTSKLLESARRQSTENASLRALLVSVKGELETKTAALAEAIANNDPAAMEAAQKDINDAVALLDADDAETAAALGENVPAPGVSGPAPAPDSPPSA